MTRRGGRKKDKADIIFVALLQADYFINSMETHMEWLILNGKKKACFKGGQ